MRSVVRRRASLVLVALAAATVAFPLGILASHQFPDVPDGNPYHADIDALVDSGVTSGCGGGNYCPSANVTREQMAAFLNRLGALGAGKTPVVNATKLDGKDSTAFVQHGEIVQWVSGGWEASADSPGAAVGRSGGTTNISNGSSATFVNLELAAPGAIGGTAYGLKAFEVCFVGSGGTTLEEIYATRINTIGQAADLVSASPSLDLAGNNCYALTVSGAVAPLDGAAFLSLTIAHGGGGTAKIATTKVTWAPGQ